MFVSVWLLSLHLFPMPSLFPPCLFISQVSTRLSPSRHLFFVWCFRGFITSGCGSAVPCTCHSSLNYDIDLLWDFLSLPCSLMGVELRACEEADTNTCHSVYRDSILFTVLMWLRALSLGSGLSASGLIPWYIHEIINLIKKKVDLRSLLWAHEWLGVVENLWLYSMFWRESVCRTLVTSRLPIQKKRMGDILKTYAAATYDLSLGFTSSAKGNL